MNDRRRVETDVRPADERWILSWRLPDMEEPVTTFFPSREAAEEARRRLLDEGGGAEKEGQR